MIWVSDSLDLGFFSIELRSVGIWMGFSSGLGTG